MAEVLLKLLSVSGGIVGLLYGIGQVHPTTACRPSHDCLARGLEAGLLPVVLSTASGVVLGAAVAVVLIRVVR